MELNLKIISNKTNNTNDTYAIEDINNNIIVLSHETDIDSSNVETNLYNQNIKINVSDKLLHKINDNKLYILCYFESVYANRIMLFADESEAYEIFLKKLKEQYNNIKNDNNYKYILKNNISTIYEKTENSYVYSNKANRWVLKCIDLK